MSAAAASSAKVQVEQDPILAEQYAEMATKSNELKQFRESLKDVIAANPNSLIVQELPNDRAAYRWLKARKFDVNKAATMFKEAIAIRKEKGLDEILNKPCPKGIEYQVVSKHGWHGYDRCGRPIFCMYTGLQHFPTLYSTGELSDRVNFTAYHAEYLRQVVFADANARADNNVHPIDQQVTIVNLRNFGWHCIKKHNYDWVQQLAGLNSSLYPESAGPCLIINAPRVFSMVWTIVKVWLDERTRNKVNIVNHDGRKELIAMIGEEAVSKLPKECGGDCICLPADQVPEHGDPCLLGHEMNRKFTEHLKKRNHEAGLSEKYEAVDSTKLKDQPEDHEYDNAAAPSDSQ